MAELGYPPRQIRPLAGRTQSPCQSGWFGITRDDPMNRQERESIVATVKAQVLAEIRPPVAPAMGRFKALWKEWGTLFAAISPYVLALIGFLYWQFGIDLNKRVDDRIIASPFQAALKSLTAKGDKLNDSVRDMNTRLSKVEGSVDQLSKDLHVIFEKQLRRISQLPQAEFEAEIPNLPPMIKGD